MIKCAGEQNAVGVSLTEIVVLKWLVITEIFGNLIESRWYSYEGDFTGNRRGNSDSDVYIMCE